MGKLGTVGQVAAMRLVQPHYAIVRVYQRRVYLRVISCQVCKTFESATSAASNTQFTTDKQVCLQCAATGVLGLVTATQG